MTEISAVRSPSFIDTYLAFRTPPRLRPDPCNPYTCLDVLVAESIKDSPPLSAMQLLDVALLFPASVVRPLIDRRLEEVIGPLQDMRRAVDAGDEPVADAIDVLLAMAVAGGRSSVLAAFSSTQDVAEALKCMHTWRLSAPAAGKDGDFVVEALQRIERLLRRRDNDGSGDKRADSRAESEAAVLEMMPDASLEAVRDALAASGNNAEAAVGLLLDEAEGSGLITIGKRTERRKHIRKIDDVDTFTGDKADGDGGYAWLKSRMDAEIARQATLCVAKASLYMRFRVASFLSCVC